MTPGRPRIKWHRIEIEWWESLTEDYKKMEQRSHHQQRFHNSVRDQNQLSKWVSYFSYQCRYVCCMFDSCFTSLIWIVCIPSEYVIYVYCKKMKQYVYINKYWIPEFRWYLFILFKWLDLLASFLEPTRKLGNKTCTWQKVMVQKSISPSTATRVYGSSTSTADLLKCHVCLRAGIPWW